ncbi:MAG: outer membrane lipoprotein carrier protein LolA [Bdellovibrionales bacterium]
MIRTVFTLILSVFFVSFSARAGGAGRPSADEANQVLAKYRKSEAFQARVKKTVRNEILGSESISTGDFYFSKGKLRMELTEPENVTLVYDGKTIWVETRLDESTIEVTKIRSKELKKNDSILAVLFDKKDILKSFNMIDSKMSDHTKSFSFEPKKGSKTELKFLGLATKDKELQKIEYKDDRENHVSLEFEDVKRGKIVASKFRYMPPAGASITDIK